MRRYPHLYEVNAHIFIRRMSEKYHQNLTLSTVPEKEWQFFAQHGFDLIWLMGVWQRSASSRQRALRDPTLCRQYDQALPGWTDQDIVGSPYAIYAYSLDPTLGQPMELHELKSKLNKQGLGLVLDFVPNHLSLDHPWTFSHPKLFVRGRDTDVRNHPNWFFATKRGIYLAHGRDPNFPPWTDTVQVNFYSNELRQALINELVKVAEICDGVRCDMAMLALNDPFGKVWGEVVSGYPRPETEFWTEAIMQVKQQRPDFLLLAEAYWGLERKLQGLGFDFTYDKILYDRLRFSRSDEIRSHLVSDALCQEHSAHFIENHDELRATTAFGRDRSLAAAVVMSTIPGLRFFHDGQFTGRRIHLPVQMVREPDEVPDGEIRLFYERLLAICTTPAFHEGEWKLMEADQAWCDNESHRNLLLWSWHYGQKTKIVIVNYSANEAQGKLRVPLRVSAMKQVTFIDELTGAAYVKDPHEVSSQGLFIALDPYRAHILDMSTG